ncbi:MAG: glucuronyl hydrolase, partial [Bacteroidota bacterium]
MNKIGVFVILAILVLAYACTSMRSREQMATADFFEEQLAMQTEKALGYLPLLNVDSTAIPRSLRRDGSLHGTTSRAWTSGFYPGELWMLYEFSGDDRFKEAAIRWTEFVEKEKYDTHTHDLGFKVYCSFGQGHKITQEEKYEEVILMASQTLIQRYDSTVGCIRSWDFNQEIWQFPVIIDNMMNLEMLFEATRLSGDSIYYRIAYQHALKTL